MGQDREISIYILVDQEVSSQVLFQCHDCLLDAMLAAMMLMVSLSETTNP